ncbi:leucine-rich repeat-containing protein 58 isoform X2 [Zootermopsis nevadensis]|uniref:leucine-rich repeat-containing protein 58 isoform X2 n=1 Tax=Zootermopsis nevadensis TaxID=136037 RepID=UPI000B8E50AC|nr:leucine-rich repeat-containing protein 58 isoform X2 [Zootermopsis nevadensis]
MNHHTAIANLAIVLQVFGFSRNRTIYQHQYLYQVLDVSSNGLTELPEILSECPLRCLIAKNNNLDSDSFPKSIGSFVNLKELNVSGNNITSFPEQILEVTSLKYLYLGGNHLREISKDIWKLHGLQILYIGGNKLVHVPDSVGKLKQLQALNLSDNILESLPATIANLKNLKSLLLHKNKLRTLPPEIVALKCLTELSLRDNPLVVRFVSNMTLSPPSLLEHAGRAIKVHGIPYGAPDLPRSLIEYLNSAHHCVNPTCKGVFFDNRVEHIKFVDFCGKYRIPLLQYLCSSKCIEDDCNSEVDESGTYGYANSNMMKKVLLG